jgi:hypothetical protein
MTDFCVFNASFNNDSVILWLSDLLTEETGVSGVIHRLVSGEETRVSGVNLLPKRSAGLENLFEIVKFSFPFSLSVKISGKLSIP